MKPAYEETEAAITLHGLGFLQIKLQAAQRLHVWHPDLPRRSCFADSAVHDHRFGFISRVLVGTQINIDFDHFQLTSDAQIEATHMSFLHEGPRTQFGNRPWTPDGQVAIEVCGIREVKAGSVYEMLPYRYHATNPGGDGRVATLMVKTSEGEKGAHSLCKLGVTPDADFDRKQWPEDRLWEIARDVLGGAG